MIGELGQSVVVASVFLLEVVFVVVVIRLVLEIVKQVERRRKRW